MNPLRTAGRFPRSAALAGAFCITFSGIFYRWSEVSPSTGVVFRCLYGLPLLLLAAWFERRELGPMSRRAIKLSAIAGVFFASDLLTFHYVVDNMGAGLATMMGNLQVVFVALAAWLLFGERPRREVLVALPIMLAGVVLGLRASWAAVRTASTRHWVSRSGSSPLSPTRVISWSSAGPRPTSGRPAR